jgi:hypothetical protein
VKECEKISEHSSTLGWKKLQSNKTYEGVFSSCVVEGRMIGGSVEEKACKYILVEGYKITIDCSM